MNLLSKISNTKHTAVDVYSEMYYETWHHVPKVSYESRACDNKWTDEVDWLLLRQSGGADLDSELLLTPKSTEIYHFEVKRG